MTYSSWYCLLLTALQTYQYYNLRASGNLVYRDSLRGVHDRQELPKTIQISAEIRRNLQTAHIYIFHMVIRQQTQHDLGVCRGVNGVDIGATTIKIRHVRRIIQPVHAPLV